MTSLSKQTELTSLLLTISEGIEKNTKAILLALDKIPSKVHKNIIEETPAIAEQVSDQVALKVVGESYYKWNSTFSFYPTIVFIFREMNVTNRPRESQVKARLSVRTEALTDEMVRKLRERAESLAGLTYNHGVVRGNYVSSDERFKTTVYGASNPQIVELFESILPVIEEPFQPNNFSFTSGPRRVSITRRNKPLAGIQTQYDDYNLVFQVEIYRVVLLVSGIERPIVLYQAL